MMISSRSNDFIAPVSFTRDLTHSIIVIVVAIVLASVEPFPKEGEYGKNGEKLVEISQLLAINNETGDDLHKSTGNRKEAHKR